MNLPVPTLLLIFASTALTSTALTVTAHPSKEHEPTKLHLKIKAPAVHNEVMANPKIHKAGTPWIMNKPNDKFQFIWVDPGRVNNITISNGYYLGKYEVTQAQWVWVMGDNPSDIWGRDLPVGGISWNDAVEFCKRLTEMERKAGRLPEGMMYTLPTQSEWEYACRAGTTTTYWWGNDIKAENANYNDKYDPISYGKHADDIKPVGEYAPNPWGFHDMNGNVYEWCAGESAPKRSKPMRGGGHMSSKDQVTSSYRHSHPAGDRISYKGLRIALKKSSR